MVQVSPMATATAEAGVSGRRRVVDAFVLHALLMLCWVAWLVPWPVWRVASSAVGLQGMGFGWRRVVLANVRHARSEAPARLPVAWYFGTQQIAIHRKTVVETLRAGVRRPEVAERLWVEGWDHLGAYLGRRGIVVVAPHAGPYTTLGLMASQWLRPEGFSGEIVVVARLFRPCRSGALMEWFQERFRCSGTTIVSVDEAAPRLGATLRRVLAANGILVLLVDEPTPTPSMAVPFFDAAIRLPLGPARLARPTGNVIVPLMASYGPGRRVRVTTAPAIEPTRDATVTLARIAGALESLVGFRLDQWAMLSPVWARMPPPAGHAYADLHLYTLGSDGLCSIEEWASAAHGAGVSIVAVTDHDHLETVRAWRAGPGAGRRDGLPGVEFMARGRSSAPGPRRPLPGGTKRDRDGPRSGVVRRPRRPGRLCPAVGAGGEGRRHGRQRAVAHPASRFLPRRRPGGGGLGRRPAGGRIRFSGRRGGDRSVAGAIL